MAEYVDLDMLTGDNDNLGRKYHSLPRGRRRQRRNPNPFCVIDLSHVQSAEDFGSMEGLAPTYGLQGTLGEGYTASKFPGRRSASASDLSSYQHRVKLKRSRSTGTSIIDLSDTALNRQSSYLSLNLDLDIRFIDAEYKENTEDTGTGGDLTIYDKKINMFIILKNI